MAKTKEPTKAQLKEEIAQLRKCLDEQADKYNCIQQIAKPIYFTGDAEKPRIQSTYDLMQFAEELYAKGIGVISLKNRDYGDWKNNDPFGNFRRHGLNGFLVRIDDKVSRLNTFCQNGRLTVMDESVLDTIIDACNYLAIMAAFIYDPAPPQPVSPSEPIRTFHIQGGANNASNPKR